LRQDASLASVKPVVAKVITEALKIFQTDKDDFELAEEFINTDPVVGGNADALALLVQKAYRGPRIRPLPTDDKTIAKKISEVREKADSILYDIDFKGILASAAINLFQDGDVIIRILPNLEFQFLPRKYVTALPAQYIEEGDDGELHSKWSNISQKTNSTKTLQEGAIGTEVLMWADYYVINEGTSHEEVIPKSEIIHIKYNPQGRMVIDQKGRTCFNIWSVPPMRRLKKTMLWKANAMINDILWRGAMPPREHHQLDLSMFSPDMYEGDSPEERVEAARNAARKVISDYISWISHKEVDVGYVTDQSTTISVLEPRSQTYADPNDLLRQLDESVHATSGIPRGAMYGEGSKSYASELLVSNYAGLRAEFIGDRIARPFENWLKQYLKTNYSKTLSTKIIDRLRLKFRLILPRDVREIAQAVNLLIDSMVVDVAQILETVGLDTMSANEFENHLKLLKDLNEAKGPTKFGVVDKKGFQSNERAVSGKQAPPSSAKELNPDKLTGE